MDFEHSASTLELLDRLEAFMADNVYPSEQRHWEQVELAGPYGHATVVDELTMKQPPGVTYAGPDITRSAADGNPRGRQLVACFEICQARRMPKQLVVLATADVACCPPIAQESLDTEHAIDMARMFCDIIGDDFDVSGPTISHHLKMLREAGLIEGERRGTWVYYRPRPDNLRQLAALLDTPAAVSS